MSHLPDEAPLPIAKKGFTVTSTRSGGASAHDSLATTPLTEDLHGAPFNFGASNNNSNNNSRSAYSVVAQTQPQQQQQRHGGLASVALAAAQRTWSDSSASAVDVLVGQHTANKPALAIGTTTANAFDDESDSEYIPVTGGVGPIATIAAARSNSFDAVSSAVPTPRNSNGNNLGAPAHRTPSGVSVIESTGTSAVVVPTREPTVIPMANNISTINNSTLSPYSSAGPSSQLSSIPNTARTEHVTQLTPSVQPQDPQLQQRSPPGAASSTDIISEGTAIGAPTTDVVPSPVARSSSHQLLHAAAPLSATAEYKEGQLAAMLKGIAQSTEVGATAGHPPSAVSPAAAPSSVQSTPRGSAIIDHHAMSRRDSVATANSSQLGLGASAGAAASYLPIAAANSSAPASPAGASIAMVPSVGGGSGAIVTLAQPAHETESLNSRRSDNNTKDGIRAISSQVRDAPPPADELPSQEIPHIMGGISNDVIVAASAPTAISRRASSTAVIPSPNPVPLPVPTGGFSANSMLGSAAPGASQLLLQTSQGRRLSTTSNAPRPIVTTSQQQQQQQQPPPGGQLHPAGFNYSGSVASPMSNIGITVIPSAQTMMLQQRKIIPAATNTNDGGTKREETSTTSAASPTTTNTNAAITTSITSTATASPTTTVTNTNSAQSPLSPEEESADRKGTATNFKAQGGMKTSVPKPRSRSSSSSSSYSSRSSGGSPRHSPTKSSQQATLGANAVRLAAPSEQDELVIPPSRRVSNVSFTPNTLMPNRSRSPSPAKKESLRHAELIRNTIFIRVNPSRIADLGEDGNPALLSCAVPVDFRNKRDGQQADGNGDYEAAATEIASKIIRQATSPSSGPLAQEQNRMRLAMAKDRPTDQLVNKLFYSAASATTEVVTKGALLSTLEVPVGDKLRSTTANPPQQQQQQFRSTTEAEHAVLQQLVHNTIDANRRQLNEKYKTILERGSGVTGGLGGSRIFASVWGATKKPPAGATPSSSNVKQSTSEKVAAVFEQANTDQFLNRPHISTDNGRVVHCLVLKPDGQYSSTYREQLLTIDHPLPGWAKTQSPTLVSRTSMTTHFERMVSGPYGSAIGSTRGTQGTSAISDAIVSATISPADGILIPFSVAAASMPQIPTVGSPSAAASFAEAYGRTVICQTVDCALKDELILVDGLWPKGVLLKNTSSQAAAGATPNSTEDPTYLPQSAPLSSRAGSWLSDPASTAAAEAHIAVKLTKITSAIERCISIWRNIFTIHGTLSSCGNNGSRVMVGNCDLPPLPPPLPASHNNKNPRGEPRRRRQALQPYTFPTASYLDWLSTWIASINDEVVETEARVASHTSGGGPAGDVLATPFTTELKDTVNASVVAALLALTDFDELLPLVAAVQTHLEEAGGSSPSVPVFPSSSPRGNVNSRRGSSQPSNSVGQYQSSFPSNMVSVSAIRTPLLPNLSQPAGPLISPPVLFSFSGAPSGQTYLMQLKLDPEAMTTSGMVQIGNAASDVSVVKQKPSANGTTGANSYHMSAVPSSVDSYLKAKEQVMHGKAAGIMATGGEEPGAAAHTTVSPTTARNAQHLLRSYVVCTDVCVWERDRLVACSANNEVEIEWLPHVLELMAESLSDMTAHYKPSNAGTLAGGTRQPILPVAAPPCRTKYHLVRLAESTIGSRQAAGYHPFGTAFSPLSRSDPQFLLVVRDITNGNMVAARLHRVADPAEAATHFESCGAVLGGGGFDSIASDGSGGAAKSSNKSKRGVTFGGDNEPKTPTKTPAARRGSGKTTEVNSISNPGQMAISGTESYPLCSTLSELLAHLEGSMATMAEQQRLCALRLSYKSGLSPSSPLRTNLTNALVEAGIVSLAIVAKNGAHSHSLRSLYSSDAPLTAALSLIMQLEAPPDAARLFLDHRRRDAFLKERADEEERRAQRKGAIGLLNCFTNDDDEADRLEARKVLYSLVKERSYGALMDPAAVAMYRLYLETVFAQQGLSSMPTTDGESSATWEASFALPMLPRAVLKKDKASGKLTGPAVHPVWRKGSLGYQRLVIAHTPELAVVVLQCKAAVISHTGSKSALAGLWPSDRLAAAALSSLCQ